MTRFINIPEYEDFFKALKETLNNYAISINKTTYTYFSEKLYIKGKNAKHTFSNLINPNTGKDLKTRELILLLDNCPEHQKPVLDFLCNRYDFICSQSSESKQEDNFQDIFLDIANINGDLAKTYFEAMKDKKIDEDEQKEIDKILYKLRSKIKGYENG